MRLCSLAFRKIVAAASEERRLVHWAGEQLGTREETSASSVSDVDTALVSDTVPDANKARNVEEKRVG